MKFICLKNRRMRFTPPPCGLILGFFDGVHLGHHALVEELKRQIALLPERIPVGAFCFSSPPAFYLTGKPAPQLTTLHEKLELLKEAGVEFVALGNFVEMANLSPKAFVSDVLIGQCNCRIAVCGFNYTFGQGGKGTAEDLVRLAAANGCKGAVVPPVTYGPHTVSSTRIRTLLQKRHPEDAARLLGRPFSLSGTVQRGKQLGRTIGLPTANLSFPKFGLVPARGVYLTHVKIGRRTYVGVSNVGLRPTVEQTKVANCETFILDFSGDIYGRDIKVSFLRFIRPEKTFQSLEALQAQIKADIEAARALSATL